MLDNVTTPEKNLKCNTNNRLYYSLKRVQVQVRGGGGGHQAYCNEGIKPGRWGMGGGGL